MYNSEQKQTFLNTITNNNSYKSYLRVFRSIQDMEETFGKDICNMSIDEIITVLDLRTGVSVANTEQTTSILRVYVDWCIQNGKSIYSENNFEKIAVSDIDKSRLFKNKYIKDPDELEKMIAVVFDEGYEYNAAIAKPKELCIRLCYAGLDDEEIVNLKKTDVDYENKTLKSPLYDGVVYHVSDRIIDLCDFCSKIEEIEFANRVEKLCDNQYILRQRIGTLRGNSSDRPINSVIVIRRVKEFSDRYNEAVEVYKNITASKLRESGIFYRIYCSGNESSYIRNLIDSENKTKNLNLSERNFNLRIRRLKSSYLSWKSVFY